MKYINKQIREPNTHPGNQETKDKTLFNKNGPHASVNSACSYVTCKIRAKICCGKFCRVLCMFPSCTQPPSFPAKKTPSLFQASLHHNVNINQPSGRSTTYPAQLWGSLACKSYCYTQLEEQQSKEINLNKDRSDRSRSRSDRQIR